LDGLDLWDCFDKLGNGRFEIRRDHRKDYWCFFPGSQWPGLWLSGGYLPTGFGNRKAIPLVYQREYEMPVFYLDQHIGTRRVDSLVENKISVELKAITKLEDVHLAQAMNYLEAYNLEVGLLINFGSKRLEFHRFTNKKYNPAILHHPNSSYLSH
jgi:GxxExxY protein